MTSFLKLFPFVTLPFVLSVFPVKKYPLGQKYPCYNQTEEGNLLAESCGTIPLLQSLSRPLLSLALEAAAECWRVEAAAA